MNNTLTKADIIDEIRERTDRTRGEVKKLVESLLRIVRGHIAYLRLDHNTWIPVVAVLFCDQDIGIFRLHVRLRVHEPKRG